MSSPHVAVHPSIHHTRRLSRCISQVFNICLALSLNPSSSAGVVASRGSRDVAWEEAQTRYNDAATRFNGAENAVWLAGRLHSQGEAQLVWSCFQRMTDVTEGEGRGGGGERQRGGETKRQRERGDREREREREGGESFATCRVRLLRNNFCANGNFEQSQVEFIHMWVLPKHLSSYPRSTCANKWVLQATVSGDGELECNVISITHHDARCWFCTHLTLDFPGLRRYYKNKEKSHVSRRGRLE